MPWLYRRLAWVACIVSCACGCEERSARSPRGVGRGAAPEQVERGLSHETAAPDIEARPDEPLRRVGARTPPTPPAGALAPLAPTTAPASQDVPGAAAPDAPPGASADADNAADRDLENELRARLTSLGACFGSEVASGQTLVIDAEAWVTPAGRVTRAQAAAPGVSAEALGCVRAHVERVRLSPPIEDGPRLIRTRLQLEPRRIGALGPGAQP